MSRRPILLYPDDRLRTPCRPVERVDASTTALVADLIDTLNATEGLGLSAPQIGVARRVLVLRRADDTTPTVMIDPELRHRGGFAVTLESCLSLPGVQANVVRASQVHVRALDADGEPGEHVLDGMDAVCFQHELDHLDGRLFIDRLSAPRRWRHRHSLAALDARVASPLPG